MYGFIGTKMRMAELAKDVNSNIPYEFMSSTNIILFSYLRFSFFLKKACLIKARPKVLKNSSLNLPKMAA